MIIVCVKSYNAEKVVKEGRETELWSQVRPEMMSEEEEENGVFVRRPPSYRSDSLNTFIDKLEYRLENLPLTNHLTPIEGEAPRGCKSWLLAKDSEEN